MEINNEQLVDMFGTELNKSKYATDRRVNNSMKSSLINRAIRQYEVVIDLGKGKYIIDKKRKFEISPQFQKMLNEELYYNLSPIILNRVKYNYEKDDVFLLSLIGSYETFNIVNKTNYNNIRYNKKTSAEQLNLDYSTVNEYFDIVTKSLKYYLEHCLDILSKEKLINYQKIKYIREKEITTEHSMDEISGYTKMHTRRATPEELQLDADIKKEIRDLLGFKSDSECIKSKEFNLLYKQKLSTYGILFLYDCYEIVCYDLDKINYVLRTYENMDLHTMSLNFSTKFEELTLENANNRHKEKNKSYRIYDKYISDYLFLTNNTLYKDSEILKLDLKPKVVIQGNSCNYTYTIKENY